MGRGSVVDDRTGGQNTTAALLARVQAGDARARAALVARMEPLLRRFARARVPPALRHQEDTGDLIQRTWLRVLEKLPMISPREPGAFFAYLRTVLINALRETLRRDGRSPIAAGVDIDTVAAVPDASVSVDDWLEYERSLERLDPPTRALVLMRYEFGMSFGEIGAELGEPADTVRMRLHRAMARLAGAVGDAGAG
jgi:RNA polymerase sigma-70 factor (ECF subfamily)